MPSPTTTTHPPPVTLSLASGQSFWFCLPPGCTLLTARGDVAVHFPPTACGQASYAPPVTSLKAGEHLQWSEQMQAVWVQLHNARHHPAEIQIVEAAPAPRLWQRIWHGLRTPPQSLPQAREAARYADALRPVR